MYDAIFLTGSMLRPNRYQSFSAEQRLSQTIDTVDSIKNKIPNSLCILIEGSILLPQERDLLKSKYDVVLECGNDQEVVMYVNANNIGIGEFKLLQRGLEYLQSTFGNELPTKYLFKLGARYYLSHNFNINNWNKNKFNFRPEECMGLKVYNTGLYSVPINRLDLFKTILLKGPTMIHGETPIEYVYRTLIPENEVNLIEIIGLEGKLSYNATFFSK